MPIYKYYPGYIEAKKIVQDGSLEDNLNLIDTLQGRDNLSYGASDSDVKAEALRQLEIEYRDCVNEEATFWVDVYKSSI